jgi:hypothetical protein
MSIHLENNDLLWFLIHPKSLDKIKDMDFLLTLIRFFIICIEIIFLTWESFNLCLSCLWIILDWRLWSFIILATCEDRCNSRKIESIFVAIIICVFLVIRIFFLAILERNCKEPENKNYEFTVKNPGI